MFNLFGFIMSEVCGNVCKMGNSCIEGVSMWSRCDWKIQS